MLLFYMSVLYLLKLLKMYLILYTNDLFYIYLNYFNTSLKFFCVLILLINKFLWGMSCIVFVYSVLFSVQIFTILKN